MTYTYFSVTGTTEIEVDEELYELLTVMDREEFNSNRKHIRRHPISLENCAYEGEWFEDKHSTISAIELAIDMKPALCLLTDLQRTCFVETILGGKSQREVAAELGKSRSTVQKAVDGAVEIIKKFFP